MSARIVLFGATGFTGDLVARALVARGAAPLLVARDEGRLAALAAELGGLDQAVADVERPEGLRAVLRRGDVLVSTVGPFVRLGAAAVEAAIARGAHYLDSTGEAPFIRDVFTRHGPMAEGAGCALVPAFGFDFVPGNLAAALALRGAGGRASGIQVGYFVTGAAGRRGTSGGTRASAAGVLLEQAHARRDGRLVLEPAGRRRRTFSVAGDERAAVSVGGTEALALPRISDVREVTTFLGLPVRRAAVPVRAVTRGAGLLAHVPGTRTAVRAASQRLAPGSNGGPSADARARSGCSVVAVAGDDAGRVLAETRLAGPNPYDLTADLLAWGALRALDGGLRGVGTLGPVDGFGLEALRAGASEAGLHRAA